MELFMAQQQPVSEATLPPGFSIIHSNRLESLREVVVQWVRRHPLRPLENEVILVQSNGMAQWLKLALAGDDGCGIAAALDFQLPARFLWAAYRAVLGEDEIPRESPYDKLGLTWRLLRLLPELLSLEEFEGPARFLAGDQDMRKRYQLAVHLADLFDQYQVYRADWLEDWASGRNRLGNGRGQYMALDREQAWQAELWRRIRADVPEALREISRAELHRRFVRAVESLALRPAGLPRRIMVFGISSLPLQALQALHAMSRLCQVLLFVHNPCRHYWADVVEDRELLRIEGARHTRKGDVPADLDLESLHQHVNPLLAAWGKQGRDYIGLLYGYDQPAEYRDRFGGAIDLFGDAFAGEGPGSLLMQVHQAILDLVPLPAAPEARGVVAGDDRSIQFHTAHSRQREVEILQDRLLAFFEEIPGLQPRDIIVMMPDVDAYAANIEAVFGSRRPEDPRYIPFSIADRPERAGAPMRTALETLLHLPESRLTVGDLVGLLEVPAFRERFGLREEDLPGLHRWIEGAGIRWGLDAEQRRQFDLPDGLDLNTWAFGLRRMLLGYAVGGGEPWREIEPYDEIGGLEAARVGSLAIILEALDTHRKALEQPAGADIWCRRILTLTDDCFAPVTDRDRLTRSLLEEVLVQWQTACEEAGLTEALPLEVVREAVLGAMSASSVSQRFLAGMVNFCTLMPMRAIPFKVVCLLGMNDGEYPRSRPPLDFDLMAGPGRYRPGDRSRREDDRYLFLEALLSARERLYISYIGRSVRDNSPRVPSVLVGQLRDYLDAGWTADGGEPVAAALTCHHPLQPFSEAYFRPDRAPGLYTYAREWRAVLDPPGTIAGTGALAPAAWEGPLSLEPLIRFLKNPVQAFFNQRLQVFFEEATAGADDREPFALDNLAPFGPGAVLLEAGLAAAPEVRVEAVRRAARRLCRTGALPSAGLGEMAAERLAQGALALLEQDASLAARWPHEIAPREITLELALGDGSPRTLEDWLDGLHASQAGENALAADAARWEFYPLPIFDAGKGEVERPHSLIGLWIRHLAGCAMGLELTSFLVASDGCARLSPLARETAGMLINSLVGHWCRGLQAPLPVAARTALAWVRAGEAGDDPGKILAVARKAYEGDGFHSPGEVGYSAYLGRAFPDFESLWQAEDNRFAELARDLYAPLVAACRNRGLHDPRS
jgi:exodeoxyribonuclease V gamma subunit